MFIFKCLHNFFLNVGKIFIFSTYVLQHFSSLTTSFVSFRNWPRNAFLLQLLITLIFFFLFDCLYIALTCMCVNSTHMLRQCKGNQTKKKNMSKLEISCYSVDKCLFKFNNKDTRKMSADALMSSFLNFNKYLWTG